MYEELNGWRFVCWIYAKHTHTHTTKRESFLKKKIKSKKNDGARLLLPHHIQIIKMIINHWIIHTPNFFKERLLLIWLEFKKLKKTKKIHIWHKSLDIFYFLFISVYQQESEEKKTISSNGSCLSLCPQHVHRLQKHESSQIVEQDATNDNDLKLWIYIEWIVDTLPI